MADEAPAAPPAEGEAPAAPAEGAPPAEGEAAPAEPVKNTYTLFYFNVKALAEPLRYLFAYGGIEYEDVRVTRDEWPALKPSKLSMQQPRIHSSTGIVSFIVSFYSFSFLSVVCSHAHGSNARFGSKWQTCSPEHFNGTLFGENRWLGRCHTLGRSTN